MKTLLMSDLLNILNIQPPKSLPDHSILKGTFETSFYDKSLKPNFPPSFPKIIPPKEVPPSKRTKKKNLKKMPKNFFMTDEIQQQVLQTINNIENAQSTQLEINKLWSEIKSLFSQELDKLPSVPICRVKPNSCISFIKCQRSY